MASLGEGYPCHRWCEGYRSHYLEAYVTNGATVYIASGDVNIGSKVARELNILRKGKACYIAADFYQEEDCKILVQELARREESKQFSSNVI